MATKLLLIDDVQDLGRSGDVVNVKPGFARNFLLPRGSAVIADANALRRKARLQEERLKKAAEDKRESEAIAAQLAGVELTQVVKVDHEGHMYGSVSAHDIIELLKAEKNVAVEKRNILLKHPIKKTGEYIIALKLNEDVPAEVKLFVVAEERSN